MDNDNDFQEEEYNFFQDNASGRLLISYLKDYFVQFNGCEEATKEQIEEAFKNTINGIVKELEEVTGED